ncbi:16S rRNA (cytidine(1402)-2'-O)-methyltransferase [Limnobacter sp.]|uniref:16S rRNA (cytidine(1402)-2'-O)-methyltransferase n=1 Tax=Limnobacter sp. TaxID=2003368 RepID=UPI002587F6CE|nr:16S rRNA (cytidine(1402)-2'-O)-methyltransferase [Limnobacter sp.]
MSDTDELNADSVMHFALPDAPTLYVVATPIGNLGDLTPRARAVLQRVDRIAAEDTRNTGKLLNALGIRKPLMAHHDHNEADSAGGIVACLQRGESVALVSDAGTPAVSDPGAVLVRAVSEAGFAVVPVPGASSVLAVVAASGLVDGPFTFQGFLPPKGKARLDKLQAWLARPEPQVVFEAPHRILQLFDDLLTVQASDRAVCAGREMTKQFETFYRGTVSEVFERVKADAYAEKGEWALVFAGQAESQDTAEAAGQTEEWIKALLAHLPPKTIVQMVTQVTGLPKNQVYSQVLELAKQKD